MGDVGFSMTEQGQRGQIRFFIGIAKEHNQSQGNDGRGDTKWVIWELTWQKRLFLSYHHHYLHQHFVCAMKERNFKNSPYERNRLQLVWVSCDTGLGSGLKTEGLLVRSSTSGGTCGLGRGGAALTSHIWRHLMRNPSPLTPIPSLLPGRRCGRQPADQGGPPKSRFPGLTGYVKPE